MWISLNIDNKRWPVNKFTAKRTPRVNGRIKFLIISIIFKKGIKNNGAPLGVKWEKYWKILFTILELLIKIHNSILNNNVFKILEEALIVKGTNFHNFLNKRKTKDKEINKLEKRKLKLIFLRNKEEIDSIEILKNLI